MLADVRMGNADSNGVLLVLNITNFVTTLTGLILIKSLSNKFS